MYDEQDNFFNDIIYYGMENNHQQNEMEEESDVYYNYNDDELS